MEFLDKYQFTEMESIYGKSSHSFNIVKSNAVAINIRF